MLAISTHFSSNRDAIFSSCRNEGGQLASKIGTLAHNRQTPWNPESPLGVCFVLFKHTHTEAFVWCNFFRFDRLFIFAHVNKSRTG